MSDVTLSDPVLGALHPRGECGWFGGVWFTPKHAVEVVFEPFRPHTDDAEAREQLARAGRAYADVRRREWAHRLETARDLLRVRRRGFAGTPHELARRLCLVQVRLFYEGQSALIYHAPPPWQYEDVAFRLFEDGANAGIELDRWNDYPTPAPVG